MRWLTAGYRRALKFAIRMRYLTVAVGAAGLAVAPYLWL